MTLESLKIQAAQGDAQAACRLAAEYENCAVVDAQLGRVVLDMDKDRLARPGPSEDVALSFAKDRERGVLAQAEHCDGVVVPSSSVRIGYWRQAARAGNIAAMATYSTGAVFRAHELLENLNSLQAYKEEAVGMAKVAAQGGSPDAVLALAVAYDPNERLGMRGSLLAQLVQPDSKEALVLYHLYTSSLADSDAVPAVQLKRVDMKIALLEGQLSGAEVATAKIEAENRRVAWKPLKSSRGHRIGDPQQEPARDSFSEFCDSR